MAAYGKYHISMICYYWSPKSPLSPPWKDGGSSPWKEEVPKVDDKGWEQAEPSCAHCYLNLHSMAWWELFFSWIGLCHMGYLCIWKAEWHQERRRGRRDQEIEIRLPFSSLLPKWLQQPSLSQAKAKQLGTPSKSFSAWTILCCFFWGHQQEAGWVVGQLGL